MKSRGAFLKEYLRINPYYVDRDGMSLKQINMTEIQKL